MSPTSSCHTKIMSRSVKQGLSIIRIYGHNLIEKCQLYALDQLVSKELYNISLCSTHKKPT